ncbi:PREDICTED: vascular endothelial growth factor receptor 1 [Elephantulus edwardii]|uniref:vascular endothelial growth factor receptor 1 n=1 Tax=Elephantulus edwardii TaxID=28737 RepID=UPI0003F08FA3|nr:PREDICTED: vascular endothelial growth factor receptor 1 [Elephantulus edwardii]
MAGVRREGPNLQSRAHAAGLCPPPRPFAPAPRLSRREAAPEEEEAAAAAAAAGNDSRPGGKDYLQKGSVPTPGAAAASARGLGPGSGGEVLNLEEREHWAYRPHRNHHGRRLGSPGPAVHAAWRAASRRPTGADLLVRRTDENAAASLTADRVCRAWSRRRRPARRACGAYGFAPAKTPGGSAVRRAAAPSGAWGAVPRKSTGCPLPRAQWSVRVRRSQVMDVPSTGSPESRSASKLKGPELSIKGTQHVMKAGETLYLKCRGDRPHRWSLPDSVRKETKKLSITESACGKNGQQFCTTLTLSEAQVNHTGFYSCRDISKPVSKKMRTEAKIYVFVSDPEQPFIEMHSEIPQVIYMLEGKELIIPCRVSSPDLNVVLSKFALGTLIPDGQRIIWDNKRGFIISNATYREIGLLSCETTVNGRLYKTNYLTIQQTNTITDVRMSPPGPVKLLQGQTLTLNCTATTALNTRVQMTWSYPGETTNIASIRRRIDQSNRDANVFHSVLTINQVQIKDRGLYTCYVKSGPSLKSANVSVCVYDKAFITVAHRKEPVLETVAGKRSFRLSTRVGAFPSPEVVWLKDGFPVTEKSVRYVVHGYSLIIRDVNAEDAGNYTILLSIKESNIFKNLTTTLIVNVKPQIYENAVSSFPDLPLYPLGSRQTLTCTIYGIPQPKVKWLWQACQHNHSAERSDFCSVSGKPFILTPESRVGNKIESITQRMSVIEGKNKTASTLVVAEARIPGIYSCMAFNKIGMAKRNISFYITDVLHGFHVHLEKMPTEGEDLKLSCTVNKFLYKDVTWILLRTVNNKTTQHNLNQQSVASIQEYSLTVPLVIRNVSLEDSGTYACKARNKFTGEERLHKKEVTIRDQEAPYLLRNLSDQTVAISNSTTLDCPAKGVPEPQITWFKNNHKIQQEPGIILGPGSSTLFIERVTEEDEGIYRCKASNQKGSVESSAYLTVQGTSDKSNLELITLTCTCVAATLFWLLLTLFIRKLKRSPPEIKTDYLSIIMDPDEVPLDEQCDRLPYDASKWEFARERLKLGKSLGRGAFGKVVQASAFGIKKSPTCRTVAVKMLKEGATASEYKALMTELKILTHIGHHLNVVNLLGACTKQGGPLMVIVEYCKYGNLSNYLKSKRDLFFLNKDAALHMESKNEKLEPDLEQDKKPRLDSVTSSESLASSGFQEDKSLSDAEEEEDSDDFYKEPITMEDLISYSFQVARGMEFLSSRKCIHRDLAARNILLSENHVVKICDFGLARDIYKNPDYVRKGDTRLPLKWMAPESIFDKIYSTKSDVWSYGVLLWEIFSLGGSPYPGVQLDEDFCSRLKEGMRMRAPEYATPEIYQIMLDCWHKDPKERPRFAELVEKLGDLLQANVQQDGKDYIPLNAILTGSSGFTYSAPTFSEDFFKEDISAPKFNSESSEDIRYVNAFKFMSLERIKTFEELSPNGTSMLDDYRMDSTLLVSPLLKRFTWTESKPKTSLKIDLRVTSKSKESGLPELARPGFCHAGCGHISRRFTYDNAELEKIPCCSPPPDYNSVVLYSPPLV